MTYKSFFNTVKTFNAFLNGCLVGLLLIMVSCDPNVQSPSQVDTLPPMYPDYANITIPANIAPLNFLLRDSAKAVCVYINDEKFYSAEGNEVYFDLDDWQDLLDDEDQVLTIKVAAEYDDGWHMYKPFTWNVINDKIDPFLTYRLIEPDYEVFSNLVLQERCIENYTETNFCDYGVVGNKCMNCHTYASNDPSTSMFYVRGEGGGAILNDNGKLQKLNIKRSDWVSGSVYFGFSPSKRYIVFSTNKIIPAFHAQGSKRMEVFDTVSDVYVADLKSDKFIESPLLADTTNVETFPTFSPDGKYIYYCSARRIDSIPQLRHQMYSLCRVGFDEETGTISDKVDTIYNANVMHHSVCHPRISPDGHYLVFTIADYGTFPIWHREADLAMIDLTTNKLVNCSALNSNYSDTYHSWSSNSHWMVFASKRDDGLYGKPYFAHIDKNGKWSKPFVLPQENPTHYDNTLKSFNAPELGTGPLPFTAEDVQQALKTSSVNFK